MPHTGCAVREVPAPSQFEFDSKDPARKTVFNEPVLQVENIQGSIVPGFNKSHRIFLFLRVHRTKASPTNFKRWLKAQIPFIATADEVLAFNKLFKSTRLRADPTNPAKVEAVELTTDKDWVMPTGGGFFFTPTIEALEKQLT